MNNQLPNIYLFNPSCEYAVANGSANWQPNRLIKKMEEDLDALPLFFSKPEDYILVNQLPSEHYIDSLKKVGINSPNFILLKDALNDKIFQGVPKNKLMPWGWSPAAHKLLSPLKQFCSEDFLLSPVCEWKSKYKDLYSKKLAIELQKELLTELNSDIFLPQSQTSKICLSKNDFETLISEWGKIMVKAPWSASGRGLQPVTKTPAHPKVWEKLLGIVSDQGYAIVEPFFDKVFDMSLQFESKKGQIRFLGFTYFDTDKKGQYKGNYINGLPNNVDANLVSFIKKSQAKLLDKYIPLLEQSRLAKEYEGFFGIDTLIYLDKNKELRINPCLEINVRQTMGLLSLNLNNILAKDKKGIFRIFYNSSSTFLIFKNEMEKKYPLVIKNNRIESGFFTLTEARTESLFGAFLLVE